MPRSKGDIEHVKPDFKISESLPMQSKAWAIQKIGWTFLFVFVGLAAFGIFGDGVLSSRTENAGSYSVQYERFYRNGARMELRIALNHSEQTTVSFPHEYMRHFRLESVHPEPERNASLDGNIHYYFGGQGPMQICFYLVPEQVGPIEGSIVVNGNSHSLSHLIYP